MKIAPLALIALLPLTACRTTTVATPVKDGWSMNARLVESCCCNAICPCMVGSPPTLGYCHGNRLVQIDEGHYEGVDLDGVTLIVTFNIGNWTKLWFSDQTTEEQVAATVELLEQQGGFLYGDLLVVERVKLEVERSEGRIAYSTPSTRTEIEVLRGYEDRPIEVANLRSFRNYTQFESVVVSHTSADDSQSFEYSGTNGFSATYTASAKN
jgi:hypothetical protein